jgi:hypothetical protein
MVEGPVCGQSRLCSLTVEGPLLIHTLDHASHFRRVLYSTNQQRFWNGPLLPMSISDTKSVDIIQVDQKNKTTRLIITDHLEWVDGKADDDHLWQLQEKINCYLGYVESGQLNADYPDQTGNQVVIQVYGKFDRSPSAVAFYRQVKEGLAKASYQIEFILKD